MNCNIQNAASKIADPTRTTLEEAFEHGAEWMKYEICDYLQDIKDKINDILDSFKTGYYNEVEDGLKDVAIYIDEIIN